MDNDDVKMITETTRARLSAFAEKHGADGVRAIHMSQALEALNILTGVASKAIGPAFAEILSNTVVEALAESYSSAVDPCTAEAALRQHALFAEADRIIEDGKTALLSAKQMERKAPAHEGSPSIDEVVDQLLKQMGRA